MKIGPIKSNFYKKLYKIVVSNWENIIIYSYQVGVKTKIKYILKIEQ